MSNYPGAYDTFSTIVDDSTEVEADWGNEIQDCIENMERTLGLNPQGGLATLAARLDALEAIVS